MGSEVRRCRPLLGTLVEITVAAEASPGLEHVIEAAFAEIAQIHRLMSFHEEASDVTRFNRSELGADVRVDPRTYEVLRVASELHALTAGAFDVAVAGHLQRMGLLPGIPLEKSEEPTRSDGGIMLLPDNLIRKTRPDVAIDMGGIAKGYAVDRAIALLQHAGVRSALINAGGDLAVLGAEPQHISIRDPRSPERMLCEIVLADRAVASSAGIFDPISGELQGRHSIVDPSRGVPVGDLAGATVCASSCMIADALTKVVMLMGEGSLAVLAHYGAAALAVSSSGDVLCTPDWPSAAAHAA